MSDYPNVQIVYRVGISFSAKCSWYGVTRYVRCKEAFEREWNFVTYSYKEVGETITDICTNSSMLKKYATETGRPV